MSLLSWLLRAGRDRTMVENGRYSAVQGGLGRFIEKLEDRSLLAAFTPGNLLALRVGDGSASLASNAAAVSLVEISRTSGETVQTINVPSAGADALTLTGNSSTTGLLSLSADGNLVTFGGYRVDAGATDPATTGTSPAGQVPRVIGIVNSQGLVSTSQAIGANGDQSFWNGQLRSVVTSDGTSFWASGNAQNGANGGTRYVANTAATSSASILDAAFGDTRQLQILDGKLFMTTGAPSPGRSVFQVGTGLPTTGPAALTASIPTASTLQANSFYFTDLDASLGWNATRFDTLYVVSTSPTQITKYAFDGTNWLNKGSVTLPFASSIVGFTTGAEVTLLVTSSAAVNGLIDASGPTGTLSGAFSPMNLAGINFAYRGLAVVPGTKITDINLSNTTVAEDVPPGADVGIVIATSPTGESYHFQLVAGAGDTDNGTFAVSGIDLRTAAALDFETQSSYSVRIRATDRGGRTAFEEAFTITVTDTNDNPPVITTTAFSPAELQTAAGVVLATDSDGGTISFSKSGGADGDLFSIASTGEITFLTAPDFEAPADANGDGVYEIEVTASDGMFTDVETVLITVTDANEPPGVALRNAVTELAEDADTSSRMKVADIDVLDDALGDETLTLTGDDAALFEIFDGDLYLQTNVALDFETNPALDVVVHVNDTEVGGDPDGSAALAIAVTNVNESPRIDFQTHPLVYIENSAPRRIVRGAAVTDPDSANFEGGSLSVSLTSGLDPANDVLGIESTGSGPGEIQVASGVVHYEGVPIGTIDLTDNGTNGNPLIVHFDANATPTAVQALVRSVTFLTNGDAPSTAARQVAFVISDGDGAANAPRSRQIDVVAVNDRPRLHVQGSRRYTERAPAVQIVRIAPVLDADDPHFNGGSLTIGLGAGGEMADELSIREFGGIATAGEEVFYDGNLIGTFTGGMNLAPLVVTFTTEQATQSAVKALIESLGFRSYSKDPSPGPHVIEFTLNDGESNSNLKTRTLEVIPVNNAPRISKGGGTIGYTRGDPGFNLLPVSEVLEDQPHFAGGNLRVSSGGATALDLLVIKGEFAVEAGTNRVFLGDVASGTEIGVLNANGGRGTTDLVVTFNSNATITVVQELIRSIRFRTTGGAGSRTIGFQLTDALGLAGNTMTRTVNVVDSV